MRNFDENPYASARPAAEPSDSHDESLLPSGTATIPQSAKRLGVMNIVWGALGFLPLALKVLLLVSVFISTRVAVPHESGKLHAGSIEFHSMTRFGIPLIMFVLVVTDGIIIYLLLSSGLDLLRGRPRGLKRAVRYGFVSLVAQVLPVGLSIFSLGHAIYDWSRINRFPGINNDFMLPIIGVLTATTIFSLAGLIYPIVALIIARQLSRKTALVPHETNHSERIHT